MIETNSRCTFLLRFAREILAPELCKLQGALYIPLGKSVAAVMELLEKEGRIPVGQTLYRFPHPSGANGHRKRQFEEAKPTLKACLEAWWARSQDGR